MCGQAERANMRYLIYLLGIEKLMIELNEDDTLMLRKYTFYFHLLLIVT